MSKKLGNSWACAYTIDVSSTALQHYLNLGEAELQVAVVSSSFAQCDLAALLNAEQLAGGSLIPY